jgi:ribonuclease P/MRP protein subunit RPP1
MNRTFSDLHLRANPKDPQNTTQLIRKAAVLGYKIVSVPFAPETQTADITVLRDTCREFGLDFASRVDLRPRHQDELLGMLRKLRRKFEVICVVCETKEVARQAAKDRRVDLLNFPQLDYRGRFFDRAEAELCTAGSAVLEVDVKPLLLLEGPARIRLLASLRQEAAISREFRLPVVVSSGAFETQLLRKPREMAVLASLFNLQGDAGLDAVSKNPEAILLRNREKLESGFVAPGIRVVKEGKTE